MAFWGIISFLEEGSVGDRDAVAFWLAGLVEEDNWAGLGWGE